MPDSKEKRNYCQIPKKRGITARHQRKEELLPDIQNQLKSINVIKSNINQLNLILFNQKSIKIYIKLRKFNYTFYKML